MTINIYVDWENQEVYTRVYTRRQLEKEALIEWCESNKIIGISQEKLIKGWKADTADYLKGHNHVYLIDIPDTDINNSQVIVYVNWEDEEIYSRQEMEKEALEMEDFEDFLNNKYTAFEIFNMPDAERKKLDEEWKTTAINDFLEYNCEKIILNI